MLKFKNIGITVIENKTDTKATEMESNQDGLRCSSSF